MNKYEIGLQIQMDEEQIERYQSQIAARERWIEGLRASIAQLKEARDKAAC